MGLLRKKPWREVVGHALEWGFDGKNEAIKPIQNHL
jgi:hypothetical protein